MHQRQNHLPTNISSNGGPYANRLKDIDCKLQINIMVAPMDCPHNLQDNLAIIMTKDGSIWPSTCGR